jgi:cardiolipin synthase
MISWSLAFLVAEWTIRLVMLVVVTRRRRTASSVTWLLIIFLEPVVGLILYILIANDRLPRRRLERHARLLKELRSIASRFRDHPHIFIPDLGTQLNQSVALAQKLGGMPILGGNDLELIPETDKTIDRIVADIEKAAQHVHLLFYIFADDATGQRVCEALKQAVGRGVTCRVLVDAVGSSKMLKRQASALRRAGIQIHAALPVNLLRRRVARIDLRNHRKLVVVDGRVGYTGSQNIVDASYGHKDLAWHDLMARITGPVVLELQAIFLQDWYFESGEILDTDDIFPEPELAGNISVQTLPSGPNYPTENYQRIVVDAIHEARRHVMITTPYFVPDEPLLQALEVAVLSGIDVELLVPRRSDQILVGAASRAYYEELLDAGVKVYLYEPGLLHAKTLCIDDQLAFFGTSNFDIRSFELDFEINLILYGTEAARMLRDELERYKSQASLLTTDEWQKRSLVRRVAQNTAKLLSPVL